MKMVPMQQWRRSLLCVPIAVLVGGMLLGSAAPFLHRSAVLPHHGGATLSPTDYGWQRLLEVLSADQAHGWLTWSTKCQLSADVTGLPAGAQMNLSNDCSDLRPLHLSNIIGSTRPSLQEPTSTLHYASVFFNSKAAQSVIRYGMNLPLDEHPHPPMRKAGDASSITPFDTGSVVIKATWEVVNSEGGKWPLRVYDKKNAINQAQSASGGEPTSLKQIEDWTSIIYLDTSNTPCPYEDGAIAIDIELGQTVPLDCFVHQTVTANDVGSSLIKSRGMVEGTYPYYLVLVGLHIARKETSGWTWTTFWWTNRPSLDRTHFAGSPPDLPKQYTQFAMDTTVAGNSVCFNPYQEGPEGPNSLLSNCARCHAIAAVTPRCDTDPSLGLPPYTGAPTGCGKGVATDSIWSIATARDKIPSGFLLPLKKLRPVDTPSPQ